MLSVLMLVGLIVILSEFVQKVVIWLRQLPTSNQHSHAINNDIIIDNKKRIISIDGGTGVKFVNQLNALIINGDNDRFYFEKVHVQPLPLYQAIVDVHTEKKEIS